MHGNPSSSSTPLSMSFGSPWCSAFPKTRVAALSLRHMPVSTALCPFLGCVSFWDNSLSPQQYFQHVHEPVSCHSELCGNSAPGWSGLQAKQSVFGWQCQRDLGAGQKSDSTRLHSGFSYEPVFHPRDTVGLAH